MAYNDYDLDLSKEPKSKAPVKTVPTPNVKGKAETLGRGDLAKGGRSSVGPKMQSTETPLRVKGNLDRMGRKDCAGMDDKEDADYDD